MLTCNDKKCHCSTPLVWGELLGAALMVVGFLMVLVEMG